MFLAKFHRVFTYLALWSVLTFVFLMILAFAGDIFRLTPYSSSWRQFTEFVFMGLALVSAGSVGLSLVLGIYRLAEKK